jgi:hypothetical protein
MLGLAGLLIFCLALTAEGNAPKEEVASRNFVLLFEILDYSRELGDSLAFFFNEVLQPGDQLIIYTPARAYGFSKTTLAKPKRELITPMQEKLRSDTAAGSSGYKIIINDMKTQVTAIEGGGTSTADAKAGIKDALTMYRQNLNNLEALRKVNETLLMQIINMFKTQQGKNHMVMIYQAEFRPIPNKETLTRLRDEQVISFEVTELFASEDQKPPLDAAKFIDVFTKTPITLHFIYVKPKDVPSLQNYKEHSADMFDVFSKIAQATGGIVETTANPQAGLKSLVKAIGASSK